MDQIPQHPKQAHLKPEKGRYKDRDGSTDKGIDLTRQLKTGRNKGLVREPEQAYYPDRTYAQALLEQAWQAKQDMGKAKQAIDQIEQNWMNQLEQVQIYENDTKETRKYVEAARWLWMEQLKQVMDGLNQAPQAKQDMEKTRQAVEKTRQTMDMIKKHFGRLEQDRQAKQPIKETIEGMEKAIKSMNDQLKQARQAKQNVEKTRQHFNDRFNQAKQDIEETRQAVEKTRQAMGKIIQGMEKTIEGMETTRQHWMKQLKQALEDKHAMDTTRGVIDKIIQAMEKTRPCLEELRSNQAQQEKEAMDTIDTITRELEREVNEIRTSGKNWKKKILVLFTGGTIGSVRLDDGTVVQPSVAKERGGGSAKDIKSLLLNAFEEQNPVQYLSTEFKDEALMETLSEDITKEKMEELTKKLKDRLKEIDCDGIVLTHGSDTLADTANYLAMTLADIDVPLFLVSSHFHLEHPSANGVQNLEGALNFISNKELPPGVYVTYHSKGETKVIYGSRVLQCDNHTHEFMSLSADNEGNTMIRPLGIIKEKGEFKVSDQNLFEKLKAKRRGETSNLLDRIDSLDAGILVIKPWLGVDYGTLNLDGIDAILHLTHHAGTARTDGGDNENLLKFVEKCQGEGKKVYLLMYGKAERDVYDSTDKYCKSGGLTLMNLSEEAARMKLLIAHSLYPDDEIARNKFIYRNINFEFITGDTRLTRKSQP